MQDSMTYNTGVKRIIKNGTPITYAIYIRNRDASVTDMAIDDRTPTTYEVRSKLDITWASTSAGAAISYATSHLASAAGTSRAWYEPIGTDGWYRLYAEVIADSALTEDLRASVQPNGNYGSTSDEGVYLWGAEVQYGSLNVSSVTRGDVRGDGDGGATSANGGLYMSGGGVFDVECQVDVEYFRPIRRIPFASGHTYTSGVYRQDKRRWRVTVRAADLTVTQNLQAFFNIHNGMEHPFFFTAPITADGVGFPWSSSSYGFTENSQETVTGYFSEDVLHIQEIGPSVYDISFSVEELLVK
jgi:phage-related protein